MANSELEALALAANAARRQRIIEHREHIAQTGLPVGPREVAAKRKVTDIIVRFPAPALPAAGETAALIEPKPSLREEVHEHILSIIRLSALGIERSPATYSGMGEEDRRQVVLNALNTHYRGEGTAEAFNVSGKTDILIRHEGVNLFIAECKFWTGPKGFRDALDQLFGYGAWRDTKLALIMFVRERDLTAIIEKARAVLEAHLQFVQWQEPGSESELRATVNWQGDEQRLADLTVFFVHTPAD
jgi:hypothetical protein